MWNRCLVMKPFTALWEHVNAVVTQQYKKWFFTQFPSFWIQMFHIFGWNIAIWNLAIQNQPIRSHLEIWDFSTLISTNHISVLWVFGPPNSPTKIVINIGLGQKYHIRASIVNANISAILLCMSRFLTACAYNKTAQDIQSPTNVTRPTWCRILISY